MLEPSDDLMLGPVDDLTLDTEDDFNDLVDDEPEEGGGSMLPSANGLDISGRAGVMSRDGLWPLIKCFNDLRRGSLGEGFFTAAEEEE